VGILNGYLVLDFGRYIAAPFCCQLLADMGAEVIRVERPGGEADRQRGPWTEDGTSIYFATINRNKKSITLDVRHLEGAKLLANLVAKADVLVHNLPVSRAMGLGLDYASVRRHNEKIVHLGISGFGASGGRADDPALDAIIQAMSGALSMNGSAGVAPSQADEPTPNHIPYVDFSTGLFGALATVSALLHRKNTGEGQSIDLSLYKTALSFVAAYGVLAESHLGGNRGQMGDDLVYGIGGVFKTTDGRVAINCLTDPMWRSLCDAIGRQDLLKEASLKNDAERYKNRLPVKQAIAAWASSRSTQDAVSHLAAAGVPVGPVQTVEQVLEDSQAEALEAFQSIQQPGIGEIPVGSFVPKFGTIPTPIRRPAPGVGQHNREIYGEVLGLNPRQIEDLTKTRVI